MTTPLTALRPYEGLFTLCLRMRCRAKMALREARKRRRAESPASFCNEAKGHFRSNPKGTGALGRHSASLSLLRRSVLASSIALIGTPCHPFAFADIV